MIRSLTGGWIRVAAAVVAIVCIVGLIATSNPLSNAIAQIEKGQPEADGKLDNASPKTPTGGGFRKWKSASGDREIEAELVSVGADSVRLRRRDGKEVVVPFEKLSKDDIDLVKNGVPKPGATAPAALPANIVTYKDFVRYTARLKDAEQVYHCHLEFKNRYPGKADEQSAFKTALETWKGRAEQKRVRLGSKWITHEELATAERTEEELLQQATSLLGVRSQQGARDKLLEAGKINPESPRADFALGLLNAIAARHAPTAEKHFAECAKRLSPDRNVLAPGDIANYSAALNNRALAQLRQRDFSSALDCWEDAADTGAISPELVQNLGRFVFLMEIYGGKSTPAHRKKAADLYARLKAAYPKNKFDDRCGWLYIAYVGGAKVPADRETPEDSRPKSPKNSNAFNSRRIVGNGTGFVIAPGYVVTNKHVVTGADGLLIRLAEGTNECRGQTVRVALDADLALVHCPELKAGALSLAAEPVRRGTDVMVLGFPRLDVIGSTLKSTRGTIVSLPSVETFNMLMLDATANPGNSGGPVCNDCAEVVAVLTAVSTFADKSAQNYSLGVPASAVRNFLRLALPVALPTANSTPLANWPEVDARASQSTVLILIEKDATSFGVQRDEDAPQRERNKDRNERERPENVLEDYWCLACYGRGVVECPVRSCKKGTVLKPKQRVVGRNPMTGDQIVQTIKEPTKCGTCDGRGSVDCNECYKGIDKHVLGPQMLLPR